jgi:hypothetical protein
LPVVKGHIAGIETIETCSVKVTTVGTTLIVYYFISPLHPRSLTG